MKALRLQAASRSNCVANLLAEADQRLDGRKILASALMDAFVQAPVRDQRSVPCSSCIERSAHELAPSLIPVELKMKLSALIHSTNVDAVKRSDSLSSTISADSARPLVTRSKSEQHAELHRHASALMRAQGREDETAKRHAFIDKVMEYGESLDGELHEVFHRALARSGSGGKTQHRCHLCSAIIKRVESL